MKGKLLGLALVSVCAAAAIAAGHKEHKGKPMMDEKAKPECLMMMKGASYKVTNTANGVTIEITSPDAATVKMIQEKAVKAGKGCECGKMHGDKKGPCPMMEGKGEGKKDCPEAMKKAHSCPMSHKEDKAAPAKTETKPAETPAPATGK